MIAMAMLWRPDLIVFDEPTTSLDVTTQLEVLSGIRDLVDQTGTAGLFISHDLAVVAQVAQRIVVLRAGAAVEQAETRAMLSAPRDEYTKSFWQVRLITKPKSPNRELSPQVVAVKDLRVGYGDNEVLKSISLAIARGETLALIGESGSGKSTLARAIAGVVAARSGSIKLNCSPLPASYRSRSPNELRQIQLIYQSADTALNPRQRIGEIVGRPAAMNFGLRGHALRKRITELLESVNLPTSFATRFPAELSGGQRQRVGIARALAAEPALIVCDEITSGLDQMVAARILELLLHRQRSLGLSYLFVSHDFSIVNAVADHVAVMKDGTIVEYGDSDQVIHRPRHAYTQALLDAVPNMDAGWLTSVLADRRSARGAVAGHEDVSYRHATTSGSNTP
jgi:peptide/nickel transport system ATP-binding protein